MRYERPGGTSSLGITTLALPTKWRAEQQREAEPGLWTLLQPRPCQDHPRLPGGGSQKRNHPNDKALWIWLKLCFCNVPCGPFTKAEWKCLPSCPSWCISVGDSLVALHNQIAITLTAKFTHHIPYHVALK